MVCDVNVQIIRVNYGFGHGSKFSSVRLKPRPDTS